MPPWEVEAREEIRDLVARYNSNGDSGRFAQVIELFAEDAVMDTDGVLHTGHDEIMTIFTGAQERTTEPGQAPPYLRHMTATHQIDVIDEDHASGRCYFQVLTHVGLDHWGRYVDTYRRIDGTWRFASRRVSVDGHSPDSILVPT
jgi:ketosteroid isomerase-like protein